MGKGALAEACACLIAALSKQAAADRMRWPLWLPVALGAGIGALLYAGRMSRSWAFAVVAAGLALVAGSLSAATHRLALRIALE